MKLHYLKTWPYYFLQVARNSKNFELRRNDRNFSAGDVLVLEERSPAEDYTGAREFRRVTYVLDSKTVPQVPGLGTKKR